jgi:hypothetical protein
MTYQTADSMILTRNCLALTGTEAVEPLAFLKSKITYPNKCSTIVDLATGIALHKTPYRELRTRNRVNNDPKAYIITPVYFKNPDSRITESIHCHGKVHILNCFLSEYHRDLFEQAYSRALTNCEYDKIRIPIHHIDRDRQNNRINNLMPVTEGEHHKIHNALRRGASTYDSLVTGLGEALVNSIFGADYFAYGDCSVFTSKMHGVPYTQLMLHQLSAAHLPADTTCLWVRLLNGKYASVDITGLNIYEVLSALYLKSAIEIQIP